MKAQIRELIATALTALRDTGALTQVPDINAIHVERARQAEHGDFASNIALVCAKTARMPPRVLATKLIDCLPPSALLERVELAGPGFLNFFVTKQALYRVIGEIRKADDAYGRSDGGHGRRVLVEFVSANPTGPLHVGHGRGAAYGDALVRVLRAAGFAADSEYYVNDAGRQMDILALSVWLRYLELCGIEIDFPDNAYQGDYIRDIAAKLRELQQQRLVRVEVDLAGKLGDDPDRRLDELIKRTRSALGADHYSVLFTLTRDELVEDIRSDLHEFGVDYDRWFFESELVESCAIDGVIDSLQQSQHVYESEGALWFRSSAFGDEKDRVVRRANGNSTYFASDIAYQYNKAQRGYDTMINIWGADHHGYVARVKGSMAALGNKPDYLIILFVQFAVLYRSGEKVAMSTRSGEFVTLRELRSEVGDDAARFFYALRKPEQHLDFDLDLAKSQSNDNPVYYVQYAHARICSVFRQLIEKNIDTGWQHDADYTLLTADHEIELLRSLSRFPEVIAAAALAYEPHQVAYYLRSLANDFHTYYNAHPFLASTPELRDARLALIDATRRVIRNGLLLLGVAAAETM